MSSIGWKLIRKFTRTITLQETEVTLEFLPMNCREKQLYQVYLPLEGKRIRFHMQVTKDGSFKICDKVNCPEVIGKMEEELSGMIVGAVVE